MMASVRGRVEAVKYLLNAKADPLARTSDGKTALELAKFAGVEKKILKQLK